MQTALTHPERVSSLVVVDIAPVTYEAGNEHMDEIFGIVRRSSPNKRLFIRQHLS